MATSSRASLAQWLGLGPMANSPSQLRLQRVHLDDLKRCPDTIP